MQNAFARCFIQLKNPKDIDLPEIEMNLFPARVDEWFFTRAESYDFLTCFFLLLAMSFSVMNTVRYITIEKGKQLEEVMKIMALPNWLHWISWFVRTMLLMLITITIFAATLQVIILFIYNIL